MCGTIQSLSLPQKGAFSFAATLVIAATVAGVYALQTRSTLFTNLSGIPITLAVAPGAIFISGVIFKLCHKSDLDILSQITFDQFVNKKELWYESAKRLGYSSINVDATNTKGYLYLGKEGYVVRKHQDPPVNPEVFAKMHLSIDKKKMKEAFRCVFPLILKYGLRSFKIAIWSDETARQKKMETSNFQGKEYVFYFHGGNKKEESLALLKEYASPGNFCDEVIAALKKEGIDCGYPSLADLPLARGEGYFHFRFERAAFKAEYIAATELVTYDFTRDECSRVYPEGLQMLPPGFLGNEVRKLENPGNYAFTVGNFSSTSKANVGGMILAKWQLSFLTAIFSNPARNNDYFGQLFSEGDEGHFKKYMEAITKLSGSFETCIMEISYFKRAAQNASRVAAKLDKQGLRIKQIGIPIPTFYFDFFLPFKRLGIKVESLGDIRRPFQAHPEVESTFIRNLTKSVFRVQGAQAHSVQPVYLFAEEELDKAIAELSRPSIAPLGSGSQRDHLRFRPLRRQ